jgi:hypothetical protein
VASSVCDAAAAIGLSTLSVFSGLTSKSSLINLAISGSGERHTIRFEFTNGDWCLSSHVLDRILVTEKIGTLNSVIEMVPPVVFMHVTQSCVDATLSGHSMGSRWEKLGDASSLETCLRESKSSSESRTASTYDNCVVLMINHGVFAYTALTLSKKYLQ